MGSSYEPEYQRKKRENLLSFIDNFGILAFEKLDSPHSRAQKLYLNMSFSSLTPNLKKKLISQQQKY